MDQTPPPAVPTETAAPCCCALCGRGFIDSRTPQQVKILRRLAALGMAMAEVAAKFPLRGRTITIDDTDNFGLLSRGIRCSLTLEAKLTEDARKRLDRFVTDHSPELFAATISRDLKAEEDLSVFRKKVPGEPSESMPAFVPPPGAKGRDPP